MLSLYSMSKALCVGGMATNEVIEKVNSMKGSRCTIKGTSYSGTVEGANLVRGIYGGDRYPVLVRVDKLINGQEGVVFEYSLDQVIIDQ